jgi:hypothetical protein
MDSDDDTRSFGSFIGSVAGGIAIGWFALHGFGGLISHHEKAHAAKAHPRPTMQALVAQLHDTLESDMAYDSGPPTSILCVPSGVLTFACALRYSAPVGGFTVPRSDYQQYSIRISDDFKRYDPGDGLGMRPLKKP